jgi:glucokinase
MANDTTQVALALDFGGTKLSAGLVDLETGRVIDRARWTTPQMAGAQSSLASMIEHGKLLTSRHHAVGGALRGVGISFGGPLSPDRQTVLRSMHVSGWEGVPLPRLVADAFGLPTVMDNDANLAALGEWRYGAGQQTRHMLYIQVSTGIGAGLILDARLYRGAGLAGEFGHMTLLEDGPTCACGKRGCLESLSSGWAIARDGQLALQNAPAGSPLREASDKSSGALTAKLVIEAARAGDALAQAVVARAATFLGIGIATTINLLDPELIVIGGGVAKAEDMLRPPVEAALGQHVVPPLRHRARIGFWTLGDDTTLIGAGALVDGMGNPAAG